MNTSATPSTAFLHSGISPARLDGVERRLVARHARTESILTAMPTREFLAGLEGDDPFLGYRHVPQRLRTRCQALTAEAGEAAFSDYLALVLLDLTRSAGLRFGSTGLPAEFAPGFASSLARAVDDIDKDLTTPRALDSDIFLKDLGIGRMSLVPCVTHLVYRHSGVPRRVILRQAPLTMCRAVHAIVRRTGGLRPFLEGHVHLRMRDDFNEAGRQQFYGLLASLLRTWPDARGLVGSSWYYDPRLAAISPRLAYLRSGPEAAGALFLDNGGGESTRGALARSPTRRRLFEAGEYRPRNYLMIWPRQDILRTWG